MQNFFRQIYILQEIRMTLDQFLKKSFFFFRYLQILFLGRAAKELKNSHDIYHH